MKAQADVLIVGGAVVGSACAYFLRELGFDGSLTIIERDPSYARCATARSAGGIRTQFSTPENIALSQASLEIIRRLGLETEVGFLEQGYLLLASAAGLPTLRANAEIQQRAGAHVVVETPATLQARFPWLAVESIEAGARGLKGEGWIDPSSLMNALRRDARGRGVEFVKGEVVGIELEGGLITGVRLASGQSIGCGKLVNAAGPWAGEIARMAGIALPVEPRKRFVFVLDVRDPPQGLCDAPLTVDPSGVWFRPEGRAFICGRSPDPADEPSDIDLDVVDYDYFERAIWPALAARVAAFEAAKVINAWAGLYDYNTLDQNGIIGPHPEVGNFYLANGFSGHGLQQAPAVGRAIAELIVLRRYATIDLARLGCDRIARCEPLAESNVI